MENSDEQLLNALQIKSWAELTMGLVPQFVGMLGGMDPALAASILPKLTGEVFVACSAATEALFQSVRQGQDHRHETDLKDQDLLARAYDQADSPEERAEIRNDYREARRERYAQEAETNRFLSNVATKAFGTVVLALVIVIAAGTGARFGDSAQRA